MFFAEICFSLRRVKVSSHLKSCALTANGSIPRPVCNTPVESSPSGSDADAQPQRVCHFLYLFRVLSPLLLKRLLCQHTLHGFLCTPVYAQIGIKIVTTAKSRRAKSGPSRLQPSVETPTAPSGLQAMERAW